MRSSFESLSLSQISKNTSFPIGFNLENVLLSKMEDNIFPNRKSESAREFLEDWVPVAFSNLCLLLVLVKDHLHIGVAFVPRPIHVRKIRACDHPDTHSLGTLRLDREHNEGGLHWGHPFSEHDHDEYDEYEEHDEQEYDE